MDDTLHAKCSCQQCGNHISFPLEAADCTVDCPHCGKQTRLTLEAPPPEVASGLTAAEIINSFSGPVRRTRVSFFYQVGLVFVTIMMVILPLVYVAMVAAAVY